MEEQYIDPIQRTFELYSSQIEEAIKQLKKESPTFGRYSLAPGVNAEIKFDRDNKVINNCTSWYDLKLLEGRVQKLTGDPKARLIRTAKEYIREAFSEGNEYLRRGEREKAAEKYKKGWELYLAKKDKNKTYEIQSEEQGKVKKLLTQAYSPSSNKEAVADKANELFEKLYEAGTNGAKTKKIKKRIRKFAEKMNYNKEFGLDKKTLEERIRYKI